MATNAYLSYLTVDLVDTTVSPNTFSQLEEVKSGVTVGETAPLVDVSHFTSDSREYIAGLSDGDEFSLECNSVTSSPAVQQQFIALKGETKTLRVVVTNRSVSPNVSRTYTFSAVFLGWSLTPAVGEADTLTFNFKISGGITRS